MKAFRLLLLLFITTPLLAQQSHTVSGRITDASNGENLIAATVRVVELPGVGAVSNSYGYYSITIPKGEYHLRVTYIGLKTITVAVTLDLNKKVNIALETDEVFLNSLVVSADRPEDNVQSVKMSVETLPLEKVKIMPALFGEVDVIKSLQLLPGVQSAGEGTTGLFVRGGSADQTLIQLDEATVFNASHLMGFFSVFNPDAVKHIELYKGGIPAQYGGRLSSILDIQMKDGNKKDYVASGGIGSISSRLTLEGPVVKDKSSFMISGRRTYADLLYRSMAKDEALRSSILYFYDLNAKFNYDINENDKIYVSAYFGRDVFSIDDLFGMDWGNSTATFRWNHLFNDRLFLNSTFIYSDFNYGFDINNADMGFTWISGIRDYSTKFDFSFFANPRNTLDFGFVGIQHSFYPADVTFESSGLVSPDAGIDVLDKYAVELAVYLQNEQKISERLSLQYGLRYSGFQNYGEGRAFEYLDDKPINKVITDTLMYDKYENMMVRHGLEPRFGARYLLTKNSSLKTSYNRTRQYLQIASNSTAGMPIDRWIPSDQWVKPLIGDQIALGYFRNFKNNMFETSVEGYYKWMQNVIDYEITTDFFMTDNLETNMFEGRGYAYGIEFMLKKNSGRTTGWVSYTLSKTMRQMDTIVVNNAKPYPSTYSRPHDVSVVVSHELNSRVSLSATFVYASGQARTFPVARSEIDDKSVPVYPEYERNQDRMEAYHRLDFAVNWVLKNKKERPWEQSLNFSVYNVYNRKNPFSYEFRDIINGDVKYNERLDGPEISREAGVVKTYLFGIIPSVTYNFKFK